MFRRAFSAILILSKYAQRITGLFTGRSYDNNNDNDNEKIVYLTK